MWMLLLWACGTEPETSTVTDGTACVDPGISTVTFTFEACLASCTTLDSATCTATISGETVTVTAEALITTYSGDCTMDCQPAIATCEMPALPDTGDIQVVVGGETVPLAEFVCE